MTANLNIKIISIEGNIGSGKSTLLEHLKNHYTYNNNYNNNNNKHIIFLKEPVDDWSKIIDKEGNTILKKFYENQEQYSFAFQMMAYISRLKVLRDSVKQVTDGSTYIFITERSLYTDKYVFAKMLYDQGKIEDVCYQIYLNWFDEFSKDFPIEHSIYVNTDPEKCYNRIHKRAREGEEFIPLSYLQECHNYHEDFIHTMYLNKLILNGNLDIYENEKTVEEWIQQIDNYIQ